MKRITLFAGGILFGVAMAAEDPFESSLRADFEMLASSLGVKASLVVERAGRNIRSERDGTVVLGLAPLSDLDPTAKSTSAKFYMAHELWHQKQYKLYGEDFVKASSEERRLHECQADLMGAELLIRTAPADFAPRQLQNVLDLAYSLGVPVHLSAEHPPPEQRRTAVKYGLAFGVTNSRFFSMWANELGDRTADFLVGVRQQIGFRDGMNAPEWSLQQCKMITHFSAEALAAIAMATPEIRFNKDPNAPFVAYSVPYRNISPRPIKLSLAIQSMMVPRKNPKEVGKQVSFAIRQYVVDIAPGETFEAAGSLPWYGDKEYYPALEYQPTSPLSLISAEFIGGESEGLTCLGAPVAGKTRLSTDLGKALTKLAQSASTGFKAFQSGVGSPAADSIYYASSVPIPGATETEIEVEKGGSARVYATLYSGNDEQQAFKTYERYRAAVLELCPVGVKFEESNRKRGPDLTLTFSRKTEVNLYVFNNADKGRSRVVFQLNSTKWQ